MDLTPTVLLNSLPSKVNFYDEFEKDKEDYGDNCVEKIEGLETELTDMGYLIDKIKNASCFVSGMKRYKSYPSYNDRCKFLYYWIGHKIWEGLGSADSNGQFKSLLNTVCSKINQTYETQGCKINCDTIDHHIFNDRKTVFDYFHNYRAIEVYLEIGDANCKTQWPKYQAKIKSACDEMEKYCTTKENRINYSDPYCKDSYLKYAAYCKGRLPSLECKSEPELENLRKKLESVQERMEHQAQEANDALRSATTTSSLSSIIGTLATIGAPFLLYKYKPWSSWFGTHTSGNGGRRSNTRKRRSNQQQQFDDLRETSTVGYTESSEASSTIEDSSRLRSAAYTTASTRTSTGGRNNNTRAGRGMVGYQNM